MKKFAPILILCAALFGSVLAQSVNFSEQISPIIYNNCTKCHRPGEIGPFPMTNYTEVASRAQMIKHVTGTRYMPPWMPDVTYRKFLDQRYLTDAQIKLIADWVDVGAPQGDPHLEAPLPVFPTGSQLGKPDLVLSMRQAYKIQGNNVDEYRVFVLPSGLLNAQDIAAVEFRPGNKKIVHHALIGIDTTGQGAAQDQKDPLYGYQSFGGFGVSIQGQLPGYAPGATPRFYPESIGQRIPRRADLLLQIHYAPWPLAEKDSSSINIFFAKKPIRRYVQARIILPFDLVGGALSFVIPPGQVTPFHGVVNVTKDVSLLALAPHCHLLGKSWEVYFENAAGQRTNLIRLNDWNFNWQGAYYPERLLKIPAGAKIHAFAVYDNTTNNPRNPHHPPQHVTWGEKTTDEMYYFPLAFVDYQPGDENIDLATEVKNPAPIATMQGYALAQNYPNPFNPTTTIKFTLPQAGRVELVIFDVLGRKVATLVDDEILAAGQHVRNWEAQNIGSGIYFYRITAGSFQKTMKMILVR